MSDHRLSLATYQIRSHEGLFGVLKKVSELHEREPRHRRQIALQSGVTLLQSPTGSGKTLVLGRVLESLRGALSRPVVWFWFSPYVGLVSQTTSALNEQCGSLRLRDIRTDRQPVGTRDGDVFVQTWATVAADNKNARRVRREHETSLSFDQMIAALRDKKFFVGVVIDEAHLNFGASATVAAKFYLETLQPDFTILATATPNDRRLEAFEKKAGIEVASRVVVPRTDVVDAGLNKVGLKLGVVRFRDYEDKLIDHEQATLKAAWTLHCLVKKRLEERGVKLTPLMLVQVEDQDKGGEDPVERVREKLERNGVPTDAIASHTSGEPDPDFHTLAYDPSKEVLIFKVAVATGFDAPRAWTLVSVRPNRGKDFGLQIVGRIMRVHPLVRPFHKQDDRLDSGYVLLTDPNMQVGLQSAVDEIKAVQKSIELLTDKLDIWQYNNQSVVVEAAESDAQTFLPQPKSVTDQDRQHRLDALIENGVVKPEVAAMPNQDQDKAIHVGEALNDFESTPFFGVLPVDPVPKSPAAVSTTNDHGYPLRDDIQFPAALLREMPPDPTQAEKLIGDIAKEFCRTSDIIPLLQQRLTKAQLNLRDLFAESATETVDLNVYLSNARVAEQAQMAFEFNDSINPRVLKNAIKQELEHLVDERGIEASEHDLRRAIDLAGLSESHKLKEAAKTVQGRNVRIDASEPIPDRYFGPKGLQLSAKSAYGVFPARLNKEERDFAELLDADSTGRVKWWMRNPENEKWATRLILPSGHRFFPDFVVSVTGRSTPDGIALVEIKDDGETGRLHSNRNIEKIRVQHREYRSVFWSFREDGIWVRAKYASGLHRIVADDALILEDFVYTS